jgi:hypothetical protein
LRQSRKAGKLPRMRLAPVRSAAMCAGLVSLFALCSVLAGCPEKGGGSADKTVAEPEHAEPDDQGKLDEKAKKPAAAAPSAAGDKKADDGKDEGGW